MNNYHGFNYRTATDGEYEQFKQDILSSKDCKSCPKPPVPPIADDENYVFISYSHKDYKSVFCDLLEFGKNGARFWYDKGLPAGKEWDLVVEEKIKSANCTGVVFYLSENLFLSKSIIKEVEFTVGANGESGKNYFCVNISGVLPSKILTNIMRNYSDEQIEKFGIDSERIYGLLSAFSDKTTFILKDRNDTVSHVYTVVEQMKSQFNVVFSFSKNNLEEFSDTKKLLDVTKNFLIKNGVLHKYRGTDKDVVIPDGVTEIGSHAFSDCSSLKSVTIPNSVKEIGKNAFSNCSSLKNIVIPDGVRIIEDFAFAQCLSLERISIPNDVTKIGEYAFANCWALENLTIPNSVMTIGTDAFDSCQGLERIMIPNNVSIIEFGTFDSCTCLEKVVIPSGVTEIKEYAFGSCWSLEKIIYCGNEESWGKINKEKGWDDDSGKYGIVFLGED